MDYNNSFKSNCSIILRMEYKATFKIDCGVCYGYGIRNPDCLELNEKLVAEDNLSAIVSAVKKARHFGRDYLTNPHDNLTTVTLKRLSDANGNSLDMRIILKSAGYDSVKNFEWNKENQLVTKCSLLDHMLYHHPEDAQDEGI